jgi:hypothetical protein
MNNFMILFLKRIPSNYWGAKNDLEKIALFLSDKKRQSE